ncbi:MAG: peptidoglycan recognition family protein [Chloroherpetonaceae bacterium]|nr:N-acetylmuramoyl-L-alanine amidase [Chthonomonadaceae bacterium]MDW8208558.1 peptidoglycan recognition family protein [Chloroherpetonaceae bacterium]
MTPRGIVLHLSASRFGDAAQIDQWHRAQGWSGIGYHRVILNGVRTGRQAYRPDLDGVIQRGRPDNVMGAHCKAEGMNRCTLGIVCIGLPGYVPSGATPAPAEAVVRAYLTERQWRALVDAVARLCARYRLDPQGTFVHPDTGRRYPVLSQHSDHDPGKPFCASLQMPAVRRSVAQEVQRLQQETPPGIAIGDWQEMATVAPDAEAIEALLPEYRGANGPDGPADLERDLPRRQEKVS